jgi:hypothetical protein
MRKGTYICRKHNKTARGGLHTPLCPICREEMEGLGFKQRIGHCGQFDKVERKTRNLDGQREVMSSRVRKLKRQELMEQFKKRQNFSI